MAPRIELITTGTELLDTRVNQHVVTLGGALRSHGLALTRQTAVPDGPELEPVLREALHRADVVLVTGGLGPTTDDLTRETLASILGLPLHPDPAIADHIRAYFQRRGREAPEYVYRQAMVPEGAAPLPNPQGTAPGIALDHGGVMVFLLPGPPRELHPMWTDHVLPRILDRYPSPGQRPLRIVSVAGLPESEVQSRAQTCLGELLPDDLGYCAHPGIVDIRFAAPDAAREAEMVGRLQREFRRECFTTTGESLPEALVRMAVAKGLLLATAESCTGGLAAQRIIRVPGASAVVDRAWVTYSNEAKRECLGVLEATIDSHGAVSAEVAEAMARGALENSRADVVMSVTGIAGPTGGTADKPVGTVWFGRGLRCDGEIRIESKHALLPPDRVTFQEIASTYALEWMRQAMVD